MTALILVLIAVAAGMIARRAIRERRRRRFIARVMAEDAGARPVIDSRGYLISRAGRLFRQRAGGAR